MSDTAFTMAFPIWSVRFDTRLVRSNKENDGEL